MKICICVNGRAHEGGVTSYVNSVRDGLCDAGHQVDIITPFGISQYRETKNKFVEKTDIFLSGSPYKTFFFYAVSKALIGLRLFAGQFTKNWDVIFAQDTSSANATYLTSRFFNIPLVLVVHGSVTLALVHQKKIPKRGLIWNFMQREEKKAYRRTKFIIANSQFTADYIKSLNPSTNITEIIRNLVNEKIFFPSDKLRKSGRDKLGLSQHDFMVLCVARLTEVKGVIYPLIALKKTKKEKRFNLVYAGDGPEKEHLVLYARHHKLEKYVNIMGNIPYREINQIYNAADALVVPSIALNGVQEPLGIVALEGMATGVPVVASSIGGLKEIIRDGINGFLVKEKDPRDLSQTILNLREDKHLAEKISKNALDEIGQKYTTKIIAQRLTKIFADALRNK